jgi:membrane-bound metal-dependent hydrolase YbcI (DUF457 family)
MDTISHYMVSFTLGRRYGLHKSEVMALTLGANLPDIDAVSIILGPDAFRDFHGTYTHSIPIGLLLALAFSIPFFLYYRKQVFHFIFGGVLMHLLLDVVNMMSPMNPRTLTPFLPFSDLGINIPAAPPYSTAVWAITVSSILVVSISLLIKYVKNGDHPWRIWVDERPIVKWLKEK